MGQAVKTAFLLFLIFLGRGESGEKAFSLTSAPGAGDYIRVNLNPYNLGKYLAERQMNRPEIVAEVKAKLAAGEYYRKRTRDQKNKGTQLTVYVDRDYLLHIGTFGNETCPDCNGTGSRAKPFDKISSHVSMQFRCLKCNSEGIIRNTVTERYYTLSPEDFENPAEARILFTEKAYARAPAGAEQWVDRLASQNPRERLAACEWLDKNYVHVGMFFQEIMPMLRKARFHEANEKKKMLVWQFWAGKDIPNERKRGYYRIYADSKSGKIIRKGFYSGT